MKYLVALIVLVSSLNHSYAIDLEQFFKKSYEFEYNGNYQKAIETLKNVYDKDSYEMNLRLGWLYYMSSLFQESSDYYQKCISAKSYSIEAKFGLINAQSAMGYWDAVVKQYGEILKIDANNSKANYQLGYIYYNRKDFRNALKYFEKVVNLYPFDHDALLMNAWTQLQLSKFNDAKLMFEKVLMNTPGDESAKEGLSYIK